MRTLLRTALLLALLIAAPVRATDYFVRTTGDDGNNGLSPAQAFATISRATALAGAGDTVYIGGGVYTQNLTFSRDATDGNPVAFVADTTGARTGDAGNVVVSVSSGYAARILGDYTTLNGLIIEGAGAGLNTVVQVESATGVRFENCTIQNATNALVNLVSAEVTFDGCTLTDSGNEGVIVNADSVARLTDTEAYDISDICVSAVSSRAFIIVERCHFRDSGEGIKVNPGNASVVSTLLVDLASEGVRVEGADSTVHVLNCTIVRCQDGVEVMDGRAIIRNCIFYDIEDDSMDLNGGSIDADNTLHFLQGQYRSEGFNSDEIYADPLFASDTAFTLSLGSPAIDAGLSLSPALGGDPTTAYDGSARPGGIAWDIGAHEYFNSVLAADIPYENDFDTTVGDGWNTDSTTASGSLTTYLGRFTGHSGGQETVSITLNTEPGMEYLLTLDVYIFNSWDGDSTHRYGPDVLRIFNGAETLFEEDFILRGNRMTYDGPTDESVSNGSQRVFRDIALYFTAGTSSTTIAFQTDVTGSDETIGYDNISVVIPDQPFTDVTDLAGVGVQAAEDANRMGAVHANDFDNDGFPDIFLAGSRQTYTLWNDGDGTFTAAIAPTYDYYRSQVVLDIDNDGDLDIWATNADSWDREVLLENDGARGWTAITSHWGTAPTNNEGAAAADVDLDGYADIIMTSANGNHILFSEPDPDGFDPVRFTVDSTADTGLNLAGMVGNGHFTASADVNNDGRVDILYNWDDGVLAIDDGDGTFTRADGGLDYYYNGSHKTGNAFADYDNDGDMDVFVTDYRSGQRGRLFRNDGPSGFDPVSFTEVGAVLGIDHDGVQRSAAWGDYDNDGDLDLYITTDNGADNALYRQTGGMFELVTFPDEVSGDSHDAKFFDYDLDGDLDLMINREDADSVLLRNNTDDDRYLFVRLVGAGAGGVNAAAIGSAVEVRSADGSTLLGRREIGSASGVGGTEPLWAHFGGLDPATTYAVRVIWPGGKTTDTTVVPGETTTTIGATTIDQMLTITAADDAPIRIVRWRERSPVDD